MMYIILTELNGRPEGEYGDFERAIKALGDWSNRVKGQWLVQSWFTASQIRDLLKPHIVQGQDRVFVARMYGGNWAGTNMGQGFPEWLSRRNFDAPPPRPLGSR